MPKIIESTPVSPSLNQLFGKKETARRSPVNKRVFYLSVQAVFNAVLIGLIAKLLVALISLITNIAFYGRFSLGSSSPAGNHLGWFVMLVPVAGSILVGLMARYGSKAIRGHGIPEAMEKIILEDSKIPPVITFLKPLSAAISIGTGGPFGAEGPIIATGGALGSLTGQAMHISPGERKIILTAGACAGMAAIFGSPLAAILLAIELLLFEFSPRSIIPVALACITGAAMHIFLFESGPVFAMPSIPAPTNSALIIYIVLGMLIGIIASLVSRSVYAVEDLFEKLPIHWMWWPAIGAIAVGITGYFAPRTMGVGYDNIQDLLTGNLSLTLLLSLCFLKYISWVISLGSGTSGGTLAPLFTIGGALGVLLATVALHVFPALTINLQTAALIGMAAMFAGASRAFLTSVVFALETTGQINGMLPLIGACAAAYFVSFFFMKGSIMTEKIKRRGVKAPDSYEPDVLQTASVAQLVTAVPFGVANLPHIYATDDAGLAAEMMGKYNLDTLLVLDNKDSKQSIGVITARALLKYYSSQKQKEHKYDSPKRTQKIMVRGRKLMKKMGKE
jgi:CIC family chloride channel protein